MSLHCLPILDHILFLFLLSNNLLFLLILADPLFLILLGFLIRALQEPTPAGIRVDPVPPKDPSAEVDTRIYDRQAVSLQQLCQAIGLHCIHQETQGSRAATNNKSVYCFLFGDARRAS